MKAKRLKIMLSVLAVGMLMTGCVEKSKTSQSGDNKEISAKEMVEQAYKNLKSYQSYQIDYVNKYDNLDIKDEKLVVTPTLTDKGQSKFKIKDGIFYSLTANIFDESLDRVGADYELIKRTDNQESVVNLGKENDQQAYLGFYAHDEYKDTQYEEPDSVLLWPEIHILHKYTEFYDFNKEVINDKIVVKVTCNDLKGFLEKDMQSMKENNPDYDPLIYFDFKMSKFELTEWYFTFTMDEEYNLLEIKHNAKWDHGDGLITSSSTEQSFKNINEASFNTEKIDDVFNDLEAGKLKVSSFDENDKLIKGDVIDWNFD